MIFKYFFLNRFLNLFYFSQCDLKQKYIEDKKQKLETGASNNLLKLGEGNHLAEMKLVNESLRWRINQKQLALDASVKIIQDLKLRNRELTLALEDLNRQKNEVKGENESESVRLENQKSKESKDNNSSITYI